MPSAGKITQKISVKCNKRNSIEVFEIHVANSIHHNWLKQLQKRIDDFSAKLVTSS